MQMAISGFGNHLWCRTVNSIILYEMLRLQRNFENAADSHNHDDKGCGSVFWIILQRNKFTPHELPIGIIGKRLIDNLNLIKCYLLIHLGVYLTWIIWYHIYWMMPFPFTQPWSNLDQCVKGLFKSSGNLIRLLCPTVKLIPFEPHTVLNKNSKWTVTPCRQIPREEEYSSSGSCDNGAEPSTPSGPLPLWAKGFVWRHIGYSTGVEHYSTYRTIFRYFLFQKF